MGSPPTTDPPARSRSRFRRSVHVAIVGVGAVLAAMVLAVVGPGPEPAAAHTDLLQASPGAGQRAGGRIDFVDLVFFEPVTDAEISVLLDGESLPGRTTVPDGSIIRFSLDEPLSEAGSYEVRYSMISYDLDPHQSSYTFAFDPDAPQALRIGEVEPEGRNWPQIIATIVLVACLAGLAFLFLGRLEARRRLARPDGADDLDDRVEP